MALKILLSSVCLHFCNHFPCLLFFHLLYCLHLYCPRLASKVHFGLHGYGIVPSINLPYFILHSPFLSLCRPGRHHLSALHHAARRRMEANFTATLHGKNPPEKAFLTIRGANASPYTFFSMVSITDNRTAFINSTIAIARKYGFDGLDLDWESPNNPQDMSSLSTFFIEWNGVLV